MNFLKKYGISLVLLLLLALTLLDVKQLSDQVESLQSRMSQQFSNLDSQIGDISSNVAYGIRQANQVVQEVTVTGSGADLETKQLLAQATVKLRTYRADTEVTLVMTRDGGATEIPMTLCDGGIYTAPVALSPEGAEELVFAVMVDNDGAVTREGETWYSVHDFLPVSVNSLGGGYSQSGDQLELGVSSAVFWNSAGDEKAVQVDNAKFAIYRNGKLEQTRNGQVDPALLSQGQVTYISGNWDGSGNWEPLTVRAGDQIRLTFSCTDETGLGYEFTLQELTVETDGGGLSIQELGVESVPTLHWN